MSNTSSAQSGKNKWGKLPTTEIAYLFEQLATLSKSGISVWESLYIISSNAPKGKDEALLEHLYEKVADGAVFSQVLYDSGAFPDYAVGMVEVGEETGKVEEIFLALSQYYKNKDTLSKTIRSSVTYPLAMAAMVLVVVFVMLVQVMPVFEQVFSQLGLAMNSVSSFLLDFGRHLNSYAAYIVAIIALLAVGYFIASLTEPGKRFLSKLYNSLPITKNLAKFENTNRFAFVMALMIESGVDIANALEFTTVIVDNESVLKKIDNVMDTMGKGNGFADAIMESEVFEPVYNSMIEAGVRTGSTGEMFMNIADRYYEQTQAHTRKLISVIEPTMVAVLCLLVGMVMLSVMLPLTGILSGM